MSKKKKRILTLPLCLEVLGTLNIILLRGIKHTMNMQQSHEALYKVEINTTTIKGKRIKVITYNWIK